jgi:hypothetical protein
MSRDSALAKWRTIILDLLNLRFIISPKISVTLSVESFSVVRLPAKRLAG